MKEQVFQPFPGQRVFLEATTPEVLYSGALGAGKTKVGLNKGLFLSHHYGRNEGLIVRKVGADLPSTTLKTWFEEVLPADHIHQRHSSQHWVTIRTNHGLSRVWWTGMDRLQRIGGTQFGWIFFDECVEAEEDDWMMLEGRLRHPEVPFHQLMGATNPGPPSHFLYERFWRKGDERDPETGERLRTKVEANSLENPYLPESYRRRLNRFQGVHRDRFVLGKWVGYGGLVYGDFNPGVHIVPTYPVPIDWRRIRSVDFGGSNPFSCSWYAQEPETNTWFQYRQIYMTGRTVAKHARQITHLSSGEKVEETVADHDTAARLELDAQNVPSVAAKKDVDQGIQKVNMRLQARPNIVFVPFPGHPDGGYRFPGGAPGILFMEEALVEEDPSLIANESKAPLRTTQEFAYYKWAKSITGVRKDVPVKEHDHGLDELRYFLMHVDRHDTLAYSVLESRPSAQQVVEEVRTTLGASLSTKEDRIRARLLRRQGAKP